MKFNFRNSAFRIWYWYVNKKDKNAEILFMNYGYSDTHNNVIQFNKQDEPNRYSIQLYNHLARQTCLRNKDIVEIGCGRGGGLAYLTTEYSPASAVGVDVCRQAVSFCNRHYKVAGLTFMQGDAQHLKLEDQCCDVVINVESSHRYSDNEAFLREVFRILRPDGYFLYTDFRYDHLVKNLINELNVSGLKILQERYITKEVIEALKLDDARKRELVMRLTPLFLHKTALNFAAVIGSDSFNKFKSGKFVYFSFILRKTIA